MLCCAVYIVFNRRAVSFALSFHRALPLTTFSGTLSPRSACYRSTILTTTRVSVTSATSRMKSVRHALTHLFPPSRPWLLLTLWQTLYHLKCSSFSSNQASPALPAPWVLAATVATKVMLVFPELAVRPARTVCAASPAFRASPASPAATVLMVHRESQVRHHQPLAFRALSTTASRHASNRTYGHHRPARPPWL